MSVLQCNEVVYTYKSKYQTVRAVNGVSTAFEKGKFYAIVGKSGSGKTTLLSMLAGLDLPTEGEVLFGGKPTAKLDRDRYRRESVAVIYQSFNLFPLLTVMENVLYPLQLQGMHDRDARKIAMASIRSVGLDETFYRRFPSMLSGGEQQRVAIARALVTKAPVILADEPTGNLDTENGKNIINILKDLAHKHDHCVVVVTHDLGIADQADAVLTMVDGKVMHSRNTAKQ